MQAVKQMLEQYLGVSPAEPGQGTAWNFRYQLPWPNWMPTWAVVLLLAAAIACVIGVYLRDARRASWSMKFLLISLRVAVVFLLLLFLSQLSLSVDRTGLPILVLLIDDSASMGLVDQYSDERSRTATAQLMAGSNQEGFSRLDLVKSLLSRDNSQFLQKLARGHRLRVYRFSDVAVPVGRGEYMGDGPMDELVAQLRDLKAEGEQTRPGPAVRKIFEELRGTVPAAIVVVSDGITTTNDADRLTGVSELARNKLVPIYTVGIGSEDPARDIHLYDLLVDEVAFVDDPIVFSAQIKSHGYSGQPLDITLKERGSSEVIARQTVAAPADGDSVKLELSYAPRVEGEFEYTLQAEPLEKESNLKNNALTRHVSVREEKIRVLLADSQPRYEFRRAKTVLEREKTVELFTVLQDADVEYALEDRTALSHFPVKSEELFRFDVIILGDLNPAFLSSGLFGNLEKFVRDAGGGMLMIAGPQFNPLAYQSTPLDVMLPVELQSAQFPSAERVLVESFRPKLTVEGEKGSSLFRFDESELASRQIWKDLPKLNWLFEAPELRPGGLAFVVDPNRGGSRGNLPVISMRRFGAGKMLFHATDELWRWRPYDAKYWVQAVRYLSRSKLLGRDRAAELSADRLIYQPGETVRLRVRFLNERLAPENDDTVTVMVERRGDVQRPVSLSRLPVANSVYEGDFPRAGEGSYHAWVVAPSFSEAPPSADFRVEAPLSELKIRSLDRAELVQTAEATRGRYYGVADAEQLPDDLPSGQPIPLESQDPINLWNRWELLSLFALLLTAEWLFRKRCRLV